MNRTTKINILAYASEEQVNTADSDIKVQEKKESRPCI